MMVETIRPTISERDIVTNLAKHGTNPLDMTVASMMTQTVKKTVHPRNYWWPNRKIQFIGICVNQRTNY